MTHRFTLYAGGFLAGSGLCDPVTGDFTSGGFALAHWTQYRIGEAMRSGESTVKVDTTRYFWDVEPLGFPSENVQVEQNSEMGVDSET